MTISDLKCPACGFERAVTDAFCLMCGINFSIYEISIKSDDEKKALDEKEDENTPDNELKDEHNYYGYDMENILPSQLVMEFEESGIGAPDCPNCGKKTLSGESECRSCGIIFSKFESTKRYHSGSISNCAEEPDRNLEKIVSYLKVSGFFLFSYLKRILDYLLPSLIVFSRNIWNLVFSFIYRFRKKILSTVVFSLAIIILYYSFSRIFHFFKDFGNEKKMVAEEISLIETSERFRENALLIRDDIMARAESDGVDAARSELAVFDIPELRYNPLMILIKNRLEEIGLSKKIQDISLDDYETRFAIYDRLYEIDPDNTSYASSLKFNRLMLSFILSSEARAILADYKKQRDVLDKAIEIAEKAYSVDPSPENGTLVSRAKNERLLFYEGNDNVVMALRDDGFSDMKKRKQRKIRIWLKNTGENSFRINPDFFSVICEDGVKYSYNDISDNMITELMPGHEVEGDLFFYTKSRPRFLFFDHVREGRIYRVFP